jgi:peptidyl-prolyl cis-trans isomerase SurA
MKSWKQFNLWLCCSLLIWAMAPASAGMTMTVDRIIAKVNEKIITQSELEERVFVKMMSLQKANVQPLPSKEKVMYDELERMIEERLLIDAGQKLGLKVGEENITKAINEIKANNGLGDGDLERMLQAESKTMEEYKGNIHDQIMVSRVVGFEVRKRVTVSKEEIEEYYTQHLKDYWVSEKLQLRHILFLMDDNLLEEDKRIKRERARLALKRIRSGADFIAIAKEFSEDISASTGGDLGELERGKMVPEFEKAAFLLKEGEVSGLVETPYGLHIIKVDKIIPGETLPLDKVEGAIRSRFMDEKMKVEYREYLSQLKKNAFIENKISPPSPSIVNDPREATLDETLSPSRDQVDVLADIPPTPRKKNSVQDQGFSRFQTFEEKLRYYKELRNNNKISEGDYQKKKRELLNRF